MAIADPPRPYIPADGDGGDAASKPAPELRRRIPHYPALDGLRAIAVLAVIAYHDGYHWAQGGFLGVDLFFVLSGFLITSLLLAEFNRERHISLTGFWSRRARRLLPALLLVILVVGIYATSIVPNNELGQLRGDGFASLFYVANWRFILSAQSYFAATEFPSPFRHLWSLAIEEQFYLLWPLVFLGVTVWARRSLRFLTWLCVAGAALSVALMWALYSSDDPSRAYYGTDSRMHTVLIGCILALVLNRAPSILRSRAFLQSAGIAATIAVLGAIYFVSDHTASYYHGGSVLFAVAAAVMIASVVHPGSIVAVPLSWRPLRWIGVISYGLYLWHWPVQVFMTPLRTGIDGNALNLLRLGVTFGLAIGSFYLVERPIRRGSLRNMRARIVPPIAFATVGVVLFATTAGAVAPPAFLGNAATGYVPTLCENPAPKLQHQAEQSREHMTAAATEPSVPRRILLVGDSLACSLLPGLDAVAARDGASVTQAAVLGCGVVSENVAPLDNLPPPEWRARCAPLVHETETSAVDHSKPDLVLWYSSWELDNLMVNGHVVRFGTPADDAVLLSRMDAALPLLTRGRAQLVLLSLVDAPVDLGTRFLKAGGAVDDANRAHLNELYHEFAARHPGQVTVIDQTPVLCPGGPPCHHIVDGIDPRPLDGNHFGTDGAVLVARWLMPKLGQLG
jgi:peptidoglycan/LPS O-acetylase OafA/YrhL